MWRVFTVLWLSFGLLSSAAAVPVTQYHQLIENIDFAHATAIRHYLDVHKNTVYSKRLRNRWLAYLAKEKAWGSFLADYHPTDNTAIECMHLSALYHTKAQAEAFKNVPRFWLTGHSQANACDEVFDLWRQAGHLTPELLWQRFTLAVQQRNYRLANYLQDFAEPDMRKLMQQMRLIHAAPQKTLNVTLPQNKWGRDIATLGTVQLGRRKPALAEKAYAKMQKQFTFTSAQHNKIKRQMAITYALRRNPRGQYWFDRFAINNRDELALSWRLRSALNHDFWPKVEVLYQHLTAKQQALGYWRYWYARALLKDKKIPQAKNLLTELAKERSYYGFLASAHLDLPVHLNANAKPVSATHLNFVANISEIKLAKTLRESGNLADARRAWHEGIADFDPQHCYAASVLAHQWGWHSRAIITGKLGDFKDNLQVRFPTPHAQVIASNAREFKLQPALIFALIRQESAFQADANSEDGACGLMQLLPSTAKRYTKKYSPQELYVPVHNIAIGSKHLQKLFNEFGRQYIPVIASYNAGRNRVKHWLKTRPIDDMSIWIETLPWYETRNYVKNILAYTVVYQKRLQQKASLRDFMPIPTIFPAK